MERGERRKRNKRSKDLENAQQKDANLLKALTKVKVRSL